MEMLWLVGLLGHKFLHFEDQQLVINVRSHYNNTSGMLARNPWTRLLNFRLLQLLKREFRSLTVVIQLLLETHTGDHILSPG